MLEKDPGDPKLDRLRIICLYEADYNLYLKIMWAHRMVKTAENHRTNLMRKLNLHDVASLTRYAVEIGLIESKTTL